MVEALYHEPHRPMCLLFTFAATGLGMASVTQVSEPSNERMFAWPIQDEPTSSGS